MLKVGWAQYPVARENIYDHAHFVTNHAHFLHDRDCYREFLDEKTNCKLNGIDLEAIEAHSLILATADLLDWISF